ncbi:MAG: hypothetical protein ACI8QS_002008 [Planctomycetota bacterium]|jgi:hypothetical protein
MAYVLVMFMIGWGWWWAIIASWVYVWKRAKPGRKVMAVAVMAGMEGAIVWFASLFPIGAGLVVMPIFMAIFPLLLILRDWFGVDATGLLG